MRLKRHFMWGAWIAVTLLSICVTLGISAQPTQPIPPTARQTQAPSKDQNNSHETQQDAQHSAPSIVIQAHQLQASSKAEQQQANAEPNKWTDPITLFTGALVLVGIGQIFVYWKQKRVMEQSLAATQRATEISRDALTMLQRAFVSFDGVRHQSHASPQGVWWSLHSFWRNSGASPTVSFRVFLSSYLGETEMPEGYDLSPRGERHVSALGPNASISRGEIPINGSDLLAVRDRKKFLYLWGQADYRDIFEGTPDHVTKFFFQLIGVRGDPTQVWDDKTNMVELIWETQPRHNCADEECD